MGFSLFGDTPSFLSDVKDAILKAKEVACAIDWSEYYLSPVDCVTRVPSVVK